MMEVAPCATPQFYTLHFTFYISHAATPFRPSALGKPHRHEPGIRPTRTISLLLRRFSCFLKTRTILNDVVVATVGVKLTLLLADGDLVEAIASLAPPKPF